MTIGAMMLALRIICKIVLFYTSITLSAYTASAEIRYTGANLVIADGGLLFELGPGPSKKEADDAWYARDQFTGEPIGIQSVIGSYHRFENRVRSQLELLRANGIDKMSLLIWHADLNPGDPRFSDGTWGHVVSSHASRLLPQHEQNLRNYLMLLKQMNFSEIVVRWGLQGKNRPRDWGEWDEEKYQHSWEFLQYSREIVEEELADSSVLIWYDLGSELGGFAPNSITGRYAARLWKDYRYTFGTEDTVGFSVATLPTGERVHNLLAMFRAANAFPMRIAVDVNGNVETRLRGTYRALSKQDLLGLDIVILETYAGSLSIIDEISRSSLNVVDVYAWPLTDNRSRHFDRLVPLVSSISGIEVTCPEADCLEIVANNIGDVFVIRTVDVDGLKDLREYDKSETFETKRSGRVTTTSIQLQSKLEQNLFNAGKLCIAIDSLTVGSSTECVTAMN
ncbi:hypothetical protein [Roseibium alexandrii]|uniref:hypothetical protein n=1 Tax=Roseibium alexandrii TaxID=388408 RepID=UPI003752CAF2